MAAMGNKAAGKQRLKAALKKKKTIDTAVTRRPTDGEQHSFLFFET